MAEAKFKVGDRVRRTSVGVTMGGVQQGMTGAVTAIDERNAVSVVFDPWPSAYKYLPNEQDKLELVAPASEPQPAPAQPGIYDVAQQMAAARGMQNAQAYAQQRQQQGLGQLKVLEEECDRSLEQIEELKATCNAQSNLLVGLRSELADVKAERDYYFDRFKGEELRANWLERENARLAGKKGAR